MERMDYQGIKIMPETLRQIAHREYSSLIDTFAHDSHPNIIQLLASLILSCGVVDHLNVREFYKAQMIVDEIRANGWAVPYSLLKRLKVNGQDAGNAK